MIAKLCAMCDVSTWSEAVPSWLEALATVGALGAAIFAGVLARRLYGIEIEREERLQAGKVAAWISTDAHPDLADTALFGAPLHHTVLRNASDLPVYDVILLYRVGDGASIGTETVAVLPPTDEPRHTPLPDSVRPHLPHDVDQRPMYVLITFTDSAGRQWTRAFDGELTRRPDKGTN